MSQSEAHSRLMDAVYRRQRHIYDVTRKYYLLGRDRLIDDLQPLPGENVLEIGCGTGRNLIVAARRYPHATFFGIDISDEMLTTARANIAKAGLSGRIRVAKGDATDFSPMEIFGFRQFERVYISYSLSMIRDWRSSIAAALAALAPEGRLLLVDFGQQERLPVFARALLQTWLARFHVTPRQDLDAALRAAAADVGRRVLFLPLYRGYSWLFVVGA